MIVYYGIVIEGNEYRPDGTYMKEPVRVASKEPIGKEPDFCCERMKILYGQRHFYIFDPGTGMSDIYLADNGPPYESYGCNRINFCQYCGAKIELKHNTNLKVTEVEKTHTEGWYEEV